MKKQTGSTAVVILVCILSVIATGGLFIWGMYTSSYDTGVFYENQLKAAWADNENVLAAHKKKVVQALSTSKLNAAQIEGIVEKALQARYGKDGSRAAMQWIQENHPQLDQSINIKLMQIMEAGENEFKVAQTRLIDIKRSYSSSLETRYFLGEGWWLEMAGFPRVNLDDFKVISTKDARKAFETGIDTPIDFGI